ncbi:MAG: hypothetical protein WBW03_26635 [Silvibacterium sp.]
MTDKPLDDERMLQLGEERLDDYMKRLVDFMDSLDKEPREMYIPFVADMAAAHAIILRHVRMWGATEGIEEARKLFENTLKTLMRLATYLGPAVAINFGPPVAVR